MLIILVTLQHDCAGKLSMANAGPNSNSSQFFISTVPCSHLDKVNVVFGEVKKGLGVVVEISQVATERDSPLQVIANNILLLKVTERKVKTLTKN